MNYTQDNCIKIAKRYNNVKRSYLLVNPLQAKHVPVSPTKSLRMMQTLGDRLADKYPHTELVVGFAETATAIGAVVASRLPQCFYIHTTREVLKKDYACVNFSEEHSHATEQKLCITEFEKALARTNCVIFVDDEISTGKTLLNIITQLRAEFPVLSEKTIVVASIVNRLAPADEQRLTEAQIFSEQLIKIPHEDYSAQVAGFGTQAPLPVNRDADMGFKALTVNGRQLLGEPRVGVFADSYFAACRTLAEQLLETLSDWDERVEDVLILGTEECMCPALILGSEIEKAMPELNVYCHSTTRSPISICNEGDYPIKNGYQISSFYDGKRLTYVYNTRRYDKVIIVTDGGLNCDNAYEEICAIFSGQGCKDFMIIKGIGNVQFL